MVLTWRTRINSHMNPCLAHRSIPIRFSERDRNGLPFSYHKVLDLITTILPKYPHYATFKIAQDFIDSMERLFMDGPDYELFKVCGDFIRCEFASFLSNVFFHSSFKHKTSEIESLKIGC